MLTGKIEVHTEPKNYSYQGQGSYVPWWEQLDEEQEEVSFKKLEEARKAAQAAGFTIGAAVRRKKEMAGSPNTGYVHSYAISLKTGFFNQTPTPLIIHWNVPPPNKGYEMSYGVDDIELITKEGEAAC